MVARNDSGPELDSGPEFGGGAESDERDRE
jgi:hypothetical protein